MTENNIVSIIMPLFNSSKYIKETLDSVVSQTYKNWELIIVDDCSTDNSLGIVSQYSDPRIIVVKNKVNSGAAVSRNVAIKLAKGRWVACLDSDDIWEKDKLALQLDFMTKGNYSFSFTDSYYQKDDGSKKLYSPKKDSYDYYSILKHSTITNSSVIYDTTTLGKVYMPEEAIKREDLACWLKILKTGTKAYCMHNPLTTVREHTDSVSYNKTKMIKYQWNVYRKVEKKCFIKSIYYMIHWAIKGYLKHK